MGQVTPKKYLKKKNTLVKTNWLQNVGEIVNLNCCWNSNECDRNGFVDRKTRFHGQLQKQRIDPKIKLPQWNKVRCPTQGGNAQNFLGKFARFFVTLKCFYEVVIHSK